MQLQQDNGGYFHSKLLVKSHILDCNLGWFGDFGGGIYGLVL